jgi:hypothetical protein
MFEKEPSLPLQYPASMPCENDVQRFAASASRISPLPLLFAHKNRRRPYGAGLSCLCSMLQDDADITLGAERYHILV